MSDDEKAQLVNLARGAEFTFANAAQLYDEAQVLGQKKFFARALFLHQISLEECAKVEMLNSWAVALLVGFDVNIDNLAKSFTSHKAKNYTNAFMFEVSEDERDARSRADFKGALAAFGALQAKFHERSNVAKNSALYVDFRNGNFYSPADQITEAAAVEAQRRNGEFLALMNPKVRLLTTWAQNPGKSRKELLPLKTRLEQARKSPTDPFGAIDKIIAEVISEATKGKAEL